MSNSKSLESPFNLELERLYMRTGKILPLKGQMEGMSSLVKWHNCMGAAMNSRTSKTWDFVIWKHTPAGRYKCKQNVISCTMNIFIT